MTREEVAECVANRRAGPKIIRTAWDDFVVSLLGQYCAGFDALVSSAPITTFIPFNLSERAYYMWSLPHLRHTSIEWIAEAEEEVLLAKGCNRYYAVFPVAEELVFFDVDKHGFPWLKEQ